MTLKLRVIVLLVVCGFFGFQFQEKEMTKGLDLQGGTRLILEAQDTKDFKIDQDTISGILSVIRNRVNGLGVSEPIIQQKGLKQIIVELAGVKNPERAIKLIGETALLEFIEAEWAPKNIENIPTDKRAILIGNEGTLDRVNYYDKQGNISDSRPILLKKRVLTGADLKIASPGTDEFGRPVVNIEFTPAASKTFHRVTSRSIGRPIAIVLDGDIISAPNVNSAISGGKAVIQGGFSIDEMRDLVIKLKAGSLPAPVKIISHKVVGPTLGKDAIEKSIKAGKIGLILLCLYMIIMYRVSGIIAIISLATYFLLVLSLLKTFGATLTLPGIAGILLTLGMAVDANVIIFERIKEEVKSGILLYKGIETGFAKAFIAIVDANITTLIAALVLFWLGTGSIKGFAVTLSIGILVSMFTAIFVTKVLLQIGIKIKAIPRSLFF